MEDLPFVLEDWENMSKDEFLEKSKILDAEVSFYAKMKKNYKENRRKVVKKLNRMRIKSKSLSKEILEAMIKEENSYKIFKGYERFKRKREK